MKRLKRSHALSTVQKSTNLDDLERQSCTVGAQNKNVNKDRLEVCPINTLT